MQWCSCRQELLCIPHIHNIVLTLIFLKVRINSNLKALTVEELQGQKKKMHVDAFRYFIEDELPHDLRRIAEERNVSERYAADLRKEKDGVVHTVEDLVSYIVNDVRRILEGHEAIEHERCAHVHYGSARFVCLIMKSS